MAAQIRIHELTFVPFLNADQIQRRVAEMGREIAAHYQDKQPVFLGVLNGSVIFLADLIRACAIPSEMAFIRLRSYAGTQSTGEVKKILGLDITLENRHVIIVEDIVDSGRTMAHLLEEIATMHPASVAVATLLLKPEMLEFPLDLQYVGFSIPPKFVVGYGLDYNGLGRELPAIYQLKNPPLEE